MTEELILSLRERAKKDERTMSAVARLAFRRYLEAREKAERAVA